MGLILFAAFVAVPIIEIALLIELGGFLGTAATILLVVATAAAGTYLLRLQGRATLTRAQGELQQGRLPANELFDGLCLFAAGLLLLTPGLLTDGVGGALLVPFIRRALQARLAQRIVTMSVNMNTNPYQGHRQGQDQPFNSGPPNSDKFGQNTPHQHSRKPGSTIDGEYEVVDPNPEPDINLGPDPDARPHSDLSDTSSPPPGPNNRTLH